MPYAPLAPLFIATYRGKWPLRGAFGIKWIRRPPGAPPGFPRSISRSPARRWWDRGASEVFRIYLTEKWRRGNVWFGASCLSEACPGGMFSMLCGAENPAGGPTERKSDILRLFIISDRCKCSPRNPRSARGSPREHLPCTMTPIAQYSIRDEDELFSTRRERLLRISRSRNE